VDLFEPTLFVYDNYPGGWVSATSCLMTRECFSKRPAAYLKMRLSGRVPLLRRSDPGGWREIEGSGYGAVEGNRSMNNCQ